MITTRMVGSMAPGFSARRTCFAAFLFCLAGLMPAARASDGRELRFQVAPGINAHAELMEDESLVIETHRDDGRQVIVPLPESESRYRLMHADYNFDGFQDLAASAPTGQVNEVYSVYLYDPESGQFRPLVAPVAQGINCDGLWSLTADPASRTLSSTCRSGPMWYTDIYRYSGPSLWLFRTMRTVSFDSRSLEAELSLDDVDSLGVPVVWSTYDPAGRVLETAMADGLESPSSNHPLRGYPASVLSSRLALYAKAGDTTTRRYLVKGDNVELLDALDHWVRVSYQNPSRGVVQGWVKLPEPE